jgi:hypothetical protein
MTVNPPKALIAMLSLVVIAALMIADAISTDAGTGLLGMIVGYATGNGLAARSGVPVEPIIGAKR